MIRSSFDFVSTWTETHFRFGYFELVFMWFFSSCSSISITQILGELVEQAADVCLHYCRSRPSDRLGHTNFSKGNNNKQTSSVLYNTPILVIITWKLIIFNICWTFANIYRIMTQVKWIQWISGKNLEK